MTTAATRRQSLWLDLLGAQTHMYNAAGINTRCIESGSGEPLIMMHGVGGHAEAFARNVVPLGNHFRTLAIDLLGHGFTDGIDQAPTKELYARHVVDLMDAAGIERANLLGESLGGWIAVWTAMLYPDRVNRILYTVGAKLDVPVNEAARARTAAGRNELARLTKQFIANPSRDNVRERLNWLFHNPDRDVTEELVDLRWALYQRTEAQGVRGHSGGASAGDDGKFTPERLREITHPMLVLWTDFNPSAAVAEATSAMHYLQHAELQVMTDSGHWPQWEHPATFNEIVREYLQRAV
jgi:2-hydroxy-6-oxonona-2,4-dienedioate hydrolase